MSDRSIVDESIESHKSAAIELQCTFEELTDELTFSVEAKPTALDRIIQYKMERE